MTTSRHSLQIRCALLIRQLGLTKPFTLESFLKALAKHRGKAIELVPARLGATLPCGMLVSTDDVDYICFAATVTPLHANHIVAHEAAHLAYDHGGIGTEPVSTLSVVPVVRSNVGKLDPYPTSELPQVVDPAGDNALSLLQQFMPDLQPDLVRRILGRTVYHRQQENEAEMFASLLMWELHRPATGLLRGNSQEPAELDQLWSLFDAAVPELACG